MPIKDKTIYPADWKEISDRIRFVRAKGRCECKGECGLHLNRRCVEKHGTPARWAKGMVILTVAHLNEAQSGDHSDKNLKAMCQRCHLRMDAPLHAKHSKETRDKKRGQEKLF